MFGKPTGGPLRGQISYCGGIDDGDAELGLDGVQGAANGVWMNVRGNVKALNAARMSSKVASTSTTGLGIFSRRMMFLPSRITRRRLEVAEQ
jgi:hypothetical protein